MKQKLLCAIGAVLLSASIVKADVCSSMMSYYLSVDSTKHNMLQIAEENSASEELLLNIMSHYNEELFDTYIRMKTKGCFDTLQTINVYNVYIMKDAPLIVPDSVTDVVETMQLLPPILPLGIE